MSQTELQKLKVIENAVQRKITVAEAGQLLNLSTRQVKRWKARYRPGGIEWVHHGNQGRAKPWALKNAIRKKIVALAKGKYAGFNDSHLTEKLARSSTSNRLA